MLYNLCLLPSPYFSSKQSDTAYFCYINFTPHLKKSSMDVLKVCNKAPAEAAILSARCSQCASKPSAFAKKPKYFTDIPGDSSIPPRFPRAVRLLGDTPFGLKTDKMVFLDKYAIRLFRKFFSIVPNCCCNPRLHVLAVNKSSAYMSKGTLWPWSSIVPTRNFWKRTRQSNINKKSSKFWWLARTLRNTNRNTNRLTNRPSETYI